MSPENREEGFIKGASEEKIDRPVFFLRNTPHIRKKAASALRIRPAGQAINTGEP
jgi:hypothetical protein